MRRLLTLILTIWLTVAPRPAEARGEYCAVSIGQSVAISPAGRDWDLSTSGPWATGASATFNGYCAARSGIWIGVTATPALRHSYQSIGGRGPLVSSTQIGWSSFRIGYNTYLGSLFVSNGAARGGGLWLRTRFHVFGHQTALTWKAYVLAGLNPTYVGSVSIDLMQWKPGVGRVFDPVHLRFGFDTGTLTAFRIEVSEADGKWPGEITGGLRVGMLHNLAANAPLQPIGLVFIDLPVIEDGIAQLEFSAGPTMREGRVHPITGAAIRVQGLDVPLRAWLGLLVAVDNGVYASPDIGIGMVW